jgi:hypothetical protein
MLRRPDRHAHYPIRSCRSKRGGSSRDRSPLRVSCRG